MTATDNDKLVGGIREAIREALNEKEEAARVENVEALLKTAQSTIDELTATVDSKNEELASSAEDRKVLQLKINELEAMTAELREKLDTADNTANKLEERASKAENELADIAADKALAVRMSELEEAKVAYASADTRTAQETRVRSMNKEEFASYKQEMVELRAQLEKEIKAASETASVVVEGDPETVVVPADLDRALKEEAAMAAAATLDVEIPNQDLKDKFARFGKALAANLSNSRE